MGIEKNEKNSNSSIDAKKIAIITAAVKQHHQKLKVAAIIAAIKHHKKLKTAAIIAALQHHNKINS
ncbi:hypothetical protein CRU92_04185 [Arcobacter sp. FW59]|uniref:Uncharacterized protein n=1 Tax=Aliarcobacter vitoriensis TaxID=2011099 RepID=A0A366MX32_9BACT|nr:hypothetical protein CRU91_01445 [Aliarcobacter vitoriensis]RBQ31975.1 hypothetical protein CRU92_04185 [Arcobacter sp. FW59]